MITVTKRFTFEACHHLPFYKGPCAKIHGHSYKLEVTLAGEMGLVQRGEKAGMVIDFKNMKDWIGPIVNRYDHTNLNEFFANPTAEIIVESIAKEIMDKLPYYDIKLVSARLWETEDSYATYINDIYVYREV